MQDLRVLFVEDSPADMEWAAWELEKHGFTLSRKQRVSDEEGLEKALRAEPWDLVIGDFALATWSGPAALALVRGLRPDLPFLILSGIAGEEAAVASLKAGASDFISKPNLGRLGPAVEQALREQADRRKVTEANRIGEEQLRLAQRMETVGRLAGGVAHDFNNILSVVSGYANLLQMKMARKGEAPRELMEIEKAVVKATALVRHLLTFSRKQMVQAQVLDLSALLVEMVPMLRMMVGEDIRVETRLDEAAGRIRADRGQLEQIIMNLAVNAKDAMPRGGTVTFEVAAEELTREHFRHGERDKPGSYLRLTVTDTGVGIPAEILPRICEPFFTTKAEGRGTGLGLSTVYGNVQQMEANLRVESSPGNGSAFSIWFPCVAAQGHDGDQDAAPHPSHRKAGGQTVLLVEDDLDLRKLTKDILVLEGYQVLEAAIPEDALGFARAVGMRIDLLLTDLVMPRMNGKQVAEAVVGLRPGIRVLYMSGYAPESLLPDIGLLPEYHFLEKPFTPAKLLGKLRAALDAPKAEKQL